MEGLHVTEATRANGQAFFVCFGGRSDLPGPELAAVHDMEPWYGIEAK